LGAERNSIIGATIPVARLVSEANDFLPILDGVREQGIRHIKSRGTPYRSLFLEHLLDKAGAHDSLGAGALSVR
jgi:hypothetical protein